MGITQNKDGKNGESKNQIGNNEEKVKKCHWIYGKKEEKKHYF